MSLNLYVSKIDSGIDLISYSHKGDAGLDLRSAESFVLVKNESKTVKCGIRIAIPEGYAGLVWDRSGLASKKNIHVLAGVIDSGYIGEVCVVLKNLGNDDFKVEKNDKIAQLLVQPVAKVEIIETDNLEKTIRGENGFGSTGAN